jgi:hypothetical protein
MRKPASEYLVEAIEKAGVKRVYGVVGDLCNGFTDALRRRESIDRKKIVASLPMSVCPLRIAHHCWPHENRMAS